MCNSIGVGTQPFRNKDSMEEELKITTVKMSALPEGPLVNEREMVKPDLRFWKKMYESSYEWASMLTYGTNFIKM